MSEAPMSSGARFSVVDTPRGRRLVEHLHGLGPRALLAFLVEAGAEHDISDDLLRRLEGYRRVDAETLRVLGVDRLAPEVFGVAS